MRNAAMIERIEVARGDAVRFVIVGDSGAWPDPTADAIYSALVRQVAALDPPPAFLVNLGDFAGPGTPERHADYLRLVDGLEIPNLCVIGNHDLDDPAGRATFTAVHGAESFSFACGGVRFVALDNAPGKDGALDIEGPQGPRREVLAYLEQVLASATEPHRVVLMHMPPHLGGRYAPHREWGFERREAEFLEILRRYGVRLVCSAHGLAFDHHVAGGIRFVMSGGGGSGLCSHLRGICAAGAGTPEDRGALFHAVEITIAPDGAARGRVLQAFGGERLRF